MRWSKQWSSRIALAAVVGMLGAGTASAGVHTWDVNEVFTDSTGQIQFVELKNPPGFANETGVNGQTMSNGNAAQNFAISGTVPGTGTTSDKHYLLATAGFAALPGAPTPDAIIPAGSLPNFVVPAGATIAFGGIDSFATGPVPTDGVSSVTDVGGTPTIGVNSPTNFAGTTGSVVVGGAPVPMSSWPTALGLVALLAASGAFAAVRMAPERA